MSGSGRKVEQGTVISDAMDKSITVQVTRLVKHPMYGKYIRRSTNFMAHDEKDEARKGDIVEIVETRPLSKRKRWKLVRVLGKASEVSVELAPSDERVDQ
jgi:small subunit ribosomal protein S17